MTFKGLKSLTSSIQALDTVTTASLKLPKPVLTISATQAHAVADAHACMHLEPCC